jgi:hypothetical protein
MSAYDDNVHGPHAQPLYMWALGYDYLSDSMEIDNGDIDEDRVEAARRAMGMFASAQARSLTQIEKHLGELVAQQKLANVIAAINSRANSCIFPEPDEQERIERFIGDQVRTIIGDAE